MNQPSNIVSLSIAFALIMAVWTIFRNGWGSIKLIRLLAWAFGFYFGQKVIDLGFQTVAQALQQDAPELEGAVMLSLKESSSIYAIAVTPEGDTAITNATSGLKVWDIKTGRERWSLETGGRGVLSPSGKLLAVGGHNKKGQRTVELRNTVSGELLATLEGEPTTSQWDVVYGGFSHNGGYFLLGSQSMQMALYPLENFDSGLADSPQAGGKTVEPIIVPREIHAAGDVHSYPNFGFNADDTRMFVHSYAHGTVEQWSVEAQPQQLNAYRFKDTIQFAPAHFSDDGEMVFNCDDKYIHLAPTTASISSEGRAIETSVEMAYGSHRIKYHCALSPDNEWLAFGVSEHETGQSDFIYTINLWKADGTPIMGDTDTDFVTGTSGKKITPQVAQLAYSPDSRYLYVADDYMRLHIYALNDAIKVAVIPSDQIGFASKYAFSPLVAPSNKGVLLSYHSASKAVWIPLGEPDEPL
ncbi:MAG: hypothetical protein PHR16_05770 [Methylovulum sp.]|nr:hypothetical protein [Methylovulum sp.]